MVGLGILDSGFQTGNLIGWQVSGPGVISVADLSPVPVPAALPLFASALGGLLGYRRKRKVAMRKSSREQAVQSIRSAVRQPWVYHKIYIHRRPGDLSSTEPELVDAIQGGG